MPAANEAGQDRPCVLLAGGGTVGHLAPGFAVRDALLDLGVECLFVTPGEEREKGWFPAGDPEPLHVPAPRLPKAILDRVTFLPKMAWAVHRGRRLVRRERAAAVLALGGWPCAPTAIAAATRGVPLFLLVTDAVPGVVVRRLGGKASRIYATTAEGKTAVARPDKTVVVGSIVRRGVAEARRDPGRFGLVEGRPTLLVVGGSLGAKGLNDRFRDGLRQAVQADPSLVSRLQVIHSTGTEEEAQASRKLFAALGLAAFVEPFVQDIGTALRTADLVLCRGGAGTLAEVEALARPAVVVPYPHHADRQQFKNAERLVASGAAVVVEEGSLDPASLRTNVLDLLGSPARLASMTSAASSASSGSPGPRVSASPSGAVALATDLVRSIRLVGTP